MVPPPNGKTPHGPRPLGGPHTIQQGNAVNTVCANLLYSMGRLSAHSSRLSKSNLSWPLANEFPKTSVGRGSGLWKSSSSSSSTPSARTPSSSSSCRQLVSSCAASARSSPSAESSIASSVAWSGISASGIWGTTALVVVVPVLCSWFLAQLD